MALGNRCYDGLWMTPECRRWYEFFEACRVEQTSKCQADLQKKTLSLYDQRRAFVMGCGSEMARVCGPRGVSLSEAAKIHMSTDCGKQALADRWDYLKRAREKLAVSYCGSPQAQQAIGDYCRTVYQGAPFQLTAVWILSRALNQIFGDTASALSRYLYAAGAAMAYHPALLNGGQKCEAYRVIPDAPGQAPLDPNGFIDLFSNPYEAGLFEWFKSFWKVT